MKYTQGKEFRILFALISILILLCAIGQGILVLEKKMTPIVLSAEEISEDDDVKLLISGEKGENDSWTAKLFLTEHAACTVDYTGATCSLTLQNDCRYNISNWTLRINILNDCFLNGFWCGSYEVHQFRDGQETVEKISSGNYDLAQLKLEHLHKNAELMVTLQPGDYLIYYPSKEVDEDVVISSRDVTIGTIFYFQNAMDLSSYELTYYRDLKYNDGPLIWVLMGLIGLMIVFLTVHGFVSLRVFKELREAENINNAIINGLSVEYATLWLINVKNKTIQLIRNKDNQMVQAAVDKASDFEDYEVAVRFYLEHFIEPEDQERVWNEIAFDRLTERISQEHFFAITYRHNTEEEGERYFQMVFAKATFRGEENIVLAYRDVDQYERERIKRQKQLEEALSIAEEANRSKSIFLANMSHEIRTPINAVLGMNTMILRESTEDNIREYAKDVKNASNTLLALINDILDFSKIESGKMEIVEGEYRLDSVINDLVNMVRDKAEEKGLELVLKVDPKTPVKLFGDEIRVKQIILNLLNNAVKYTKKGTILFAIECAARSEEKCSLKVSVTDTGIGIKAENMDKLFSPYARLDEEKHKGVEGTGLGLPITQKLLERMNSKLEVSSVYGEGSTFSFELEQPTWGSDEIGMHLVVEQELEEKAERFHAKDAAILVVDDVEMNLIVIQNMLKRICVKPQLCLSGEEAVLLAKEKKYDIIFLDAMMPGMSGEDTLQAIREQCVINQETPIIVLTANAIVGAREEYLSKGFNDYLSKPIDGTLLENMIEQYLPAEKKVLVEAEEAESENSNQSKNAVNTANAEIAGMEKVRAAIEEIPQIDTTSGVQAAGGLNTYLTICENFASTAENRISMIRSYYEAGDIANYTIQVHALKSSARLVGANTLSQKALILEMAGKENNEETIKNNTESLLIDYNEIKTKLEKIFASLSQNTSSDNEKEKLSEKRLLRKLSEMLELVEAYDFESAKELYADLQRYTLLEDFAETNQKLKALLADVNREGIVDCISTYLKVRG